MGGYRCIVTAIIATAVVVATARESIERENHHHRTAVSRSVAQLARKVILGAVIQRIEPAGNAVISPISIASSIIALIPDPERDATDTGETTAAQRATIRREWFHFLHNKPDGGPPMTAYRQATDALERPITEPVMVPQCYDDTDEEEDEDESDKLPVPGRANNPPVFRLTESVFAGADLYAELVGPGQTRRGRVAYREVNFTDTERTRETINRWVHQETQGLISSFLAPGDLAARTRLVLASTLYFQAGWVYPLAEMIRPFEFFRNGLRRPSILLPGMSLFGCLAYGQSDSLGAQIVALPYATTATERGRVGAGITAYIIKLRSPDANREKINRLVYRLTGDVLMDFIESMQPAPLLLAMPKLDLHGSFSLRSVFQLGGVRAPFASGNVDEIIHRVALVVNETGTEGAAATASILNRSLPNLVVRVNTPFLLAVRHDATKVLLFYGPIYDPGKL